MTVLKANPMQYTKRFVPGRTVPYMFLPQVEPPCSCRCTGCYVLASEAYPKRVKRSEGQIISDLKQLTAAGYSVIPLTTEVLMNERYLEMLSAVKATYVMTNGKLIVPKPSILDELKPIGIKQVVLTANFGNSGLTLPNFDVFQEAVGRAIRAGFDVMVRITLTMDNYLSIMEMVAGCRRLGIGCIQFQRFMPIEPGPDVLDENCAKQVFGLINIARAANPDIYISAGASLGSQFRKKRFVCPAGTAQFTIGLDNRIYPCIYLTQDENALGRYENGTLIIDRKFAVGGDELDCPAYRYYASRSKNGEKTKRCEK